MAFSQTQTISHPDYGLMMKSFLLWTGILTVCLLIIGFPVEILIVTVGSLLSVVLQTVMPGVGIVLVAGGFFAVQIIGILVVAGVLTLRGVHPKNISWLPWTRGEANLNHQSTYAACPLTCDISR